MAEVWLVYYGSESNCDSIEGAYPSKKDAIVAAKRICHARCECFQEGYSYHDCDEVVENGYLYSNSLHVKGKITNVGLYSVFRVR